MTVIIVIVMKSCCIVGSEGGDSARTVDFVRCQYTAILG